MSKDLNKVMLTGRLGKDPEIRYMENGNAVAKFTVASNRRYRTSAGEDREETEWFNVIAWQKLGEICGQYLTKGSRVYIEGRLSTRSYEDKNTGLPKYFTEVVANDMIMLDRRGDRPAETGDEAEDGDWAPDPEPAPAAPAQRSRGGSQGRSTPRRPVAVAAGDSESDDDLPF